MCSICCRPLAIALVLLAATATPCDAQFGGRGGGFGGSRRGDASTLTHHVVLGHAEGLSEATMRLVAGELSRRWLTSEENESLGDFFRINLMPFMDEGGSGFDGGGGNVDGLMIRSLAVEVRMPDAQYDGVLLEQRWQDARHELQAALRRAQQRIIQQREEARAAARRALADQRNRLEAELRTVIDDLEKSSGGGGSPEQLREQFDDTRSMLRELSLDRVSVEARREAIEERIDELRKNADVAAESDPMIAELLKIQEIRERQLEAARTLNATGRSANSELAQAEADMAHARIEFLKAQRAAAEQASGGVLRELNNELSNLIVRAAEIEARTQALDESAEILADQTSVRTTARREALQQKLKLLQQRLAQVEIDQAELESQDNEPPQEITIQSLDEALGLGVDAEEEESP